MSTPDSRPDHAVAAQFDLRARAAYRQSLDQLPASVRGRLRSARGQALSAHSGWRMPRWLPTGLAATGTVRYHDYESGDGSLLGFEDFSDGKWECARGELLRHSEYRIYAQGPE